MELRAECTTSVNSPEGIRQGRNAVDSIFRIQGRSIPRRFGLFIANDPCIATAERSRWVIHLVDRPRTQLHDAVEGSLRLRIQVWLQITSASTMCFLLLDLTI